MTLTRSVIAGAALALAMGAVHAQDKGARDKPGFNEMDKDGDGSLSRSEAAGNAALLARFKEVDNDGDGKLSRAEYLQAMAKEDFNALREKAADFIEPGDPSSSAGSGGAKR